jgi:hypothetical protein
LSRIKNPSAAKVNKINDVPHVPHVHRGDSYQLREPSAPYGEHFGVKNEDIGLKNTYFWNFNPE